MFSNKKSTTNSYIVLIHGAWHGAWCWQKLIPLLEQQGYSVISPDLPGHGNNINIPLKEITLRHYTNYIIDIIKMKDLHNVTLLGHSMGGIC